MKTKKFYSFLLAACCVMTMVSLTSCHPDDEDDDNNGNGGDSKTRIEYVEFKEPCLMKGATKDEVMAWMAVNMPEYELVLEAGTVESMAFGHNGYTPLIYYSWDSGELCYVKCYGNYNIKDVLALLDQKYGDRERLEDIKIGGITTETYAYYPVDGDFEGLNVEYQHGQVAGALYYMVMVTYTTKYHYLL